MGLRGKIGVQLSTIKDKVNDLGVYEAMKQMSDLGYHCIEISQVPTTKENIQAFRKACEDFNIEVAAMSAALEPTPGRPGEALTTDFDKIVADCKALDCSYLRIGMLPMQCMGSREKALEFTKKADEMAEKLEQQGIELYYHNHHVEFQKFDGEYLLDLIKHNTSKIGFELDIHWIHRGGEDPVKVIKQYAGRISLLHLKDYRIGQLDATPLAEGNFQKFMMGFQNLVEFAEVGEGSLDIPACITAGLEGGAKYFLIEQDSTYQRDAFDSLRISAENLRKMGYSDWF